MTPETGNNKQVSERDKVLKDYCIKIGIMIDDQELDRAVNPTLYQIERTLRGLSVKGTLFEKTTIEKAITGFGNVAKVMGSVGSAMKNMNNASFDHGKNMKGMLDSLAGVGGAWTRNAVHMLQYASAAKNLKDVNKDLYNDMNILGKMFASVFDTFGMGFAPVANKSEKDKAKESENKQNNLVSKLSGKLTRVKPAASEASPIADGAALSDKMGSSVAETNRRVAILSNSTGRMKVTFKGLGETAASSMGEATKGIAGATEAVASGSGAIANATGAAGTLGTTLGGTGTAATGAGAAMGGMAVVATAGIILIIAALVALGVGLYKITGAFIASRMELKKFDVVFNGIGQQGLLKLRARLNEVNYSLRDLGFATEKVNGVILAGIQSGITKTRAISEQLTRTTLEWATVAGVETSEVTSLFAELIKKVNMTDDALTNVANNFTQYNQMAEKLGTVATISFANFKEAITSSTNALVLANARGSEFTKNMIKDLTELTGITNTLGMSMSEINSKFEEAGSLLNSANSGFRTMLILTKSANLDNIMDNNFNKAESMMKMMDWAKNFSVQFGGNLNVTAQVMSKNFGVSQEMALRLLTVTKEQRKSMQDMSTLMKGMNNDKVSKAYKDVTNNLVDSWEKVKASVSNVFMRAISGSNGFAKLESALTGVVNRLQKIVNGPTMTKIINWAVGLFDSLAGWISKTVDRLSDLIDSVQDPEQGPWETLGKGLMVSFGPVIDLLLAAAEKFGAALVNGVMKNIPIIGSLIADATGQGGPGAESRNSGRMTGAATGALIGSLIAPGIGTAIGAVAGGILGDKLAPFFEKDQKMTEKERMASLTGLKTTFNGVLAKLAEQIANNSTKLGEYNQLGMKDMDVTYGMKKKRDATGKLVDDGEGFMTMGERRNWLEQENADLAKQKTEKEEEFRNVMKKQGDEQIALLTALVKASGGKVPEGTTPKQTVTPAPAPSPVVQRARYSSSIA